MFDVVEYKKKYTKRLYDERREKGLCVKCGGPSRPGKVYCAKCAARESKYNLKRKTSYKGRKRKKGRKAKEYALYKGDELIIIGTVKEMAKKLNVKECSIYGIKCNSYQNRVKNSRTLIEI